MREARTLERAGVRWWLRAGEDADALAPGLARALAQLASAPDLRAGRRKRLFRLALGEGGEITHLLKRSGYPPARGWLRAVLGSKARRELAIAQGLAERGVPVVVPLAAGERRRSRVSGLAECFLLSPLLPAAQDLKRRSQDPRLPPRERRRLATALGRLIRDAHAAGLLQHDLAPNNVLVCGEDASELRLIDFERARLRRRVSARARRRMLAKLARAAGALPATQRLRFLIAYAGDAAAARRWWSRLRAEAPRLARRDDTRLRRITTREGRRFARFADGDWRGFARRGAAFAPALADPAPGPAAAKGGAVVERAGACWRVTCARRSARGAGRLFARAEALAARGLAPHPLACLSDRERTLLVLEAWAGARPLAAGALDAPARRALARLLAELCALGELSGTLDVAMFALAPGGAGGPRAVLLAPHAFRFSGRPARAAGRAAAAQLLVGPVAPAVQFAP